MAASKLRSLAKFTACDISDALLKLKVPKAGFLADISPFAPNTPASEKLADQPKVIAPASTVLLVPKNEGSPGDSSYQGVKETNIPNDSHYVDLTKPDTVVVLSQPRGQTCAILGGIMALRMKMRGAKGIVAGGRVRDLRELRALDFPIWAEATSTVATGMEAKPWAIEVPIEVHGVTINPGDIIFADPVEGVVVCPKDKLDEVIELLPKITEADDKVMDDVRDGGLVHAAFAKHR